VRNCQWQAGFEARAQCPARCGLAAIEKLALVFAKGRNLLMFDCRYCHIHWR